ncbi:MAG: glycosyltransferase family 2 protein [Candidatus Omnitrophica bacterium]|nr:glycosyltransferase family 2 protein [Candidatus Omnitrophota bacterium]
MYLSIVIPAYNEEKSIEGALDGIFRFMGTKDYDYETILVDDGSGDSTAFRAEQSDLAKAGLLRLIKNETNRGKGYSVRKGILSSRGEYVLFTDADMSTPIEEIDKLFGALDKGHDIAIGSRGVKGSNVRPRQPWYRQSMGKMFNLLVKLLVIKGVNDTQCGFKLFKGAIAREIAPLLRIEGFCFDVEMLYLAGKKGCRIKETGIVWGHSSGSKVRLVGSSSRMFSDLMKIKTMHNENTL